jgi:hypothetical protein
MQPIIFLELNEVNFDYIRAYHTRGELPVLGGFIAAHGYAQTTSEADYEELEPWIQWVTAHTGMSLAEHGVFRLGDIVGSDAKQIWERLVERGVSVGAISPMNTNRSTHDWDFFIPDPWTQTGIVASPVVSRMYRAIAQAVNDNAQSRITPSSFANLLGGAVAAMSPKNYAKCFFGTNQALDESDFFGFTPCRPVRRACEEKQNGFRHSFFECRGTYPASLHVFIASI